tara:strand:+ start:493 stop:1119 length:627 start_codon:yes stop_codon:yes gene_type:complete
MSEVIYISRRCEYCHELLILLHKNRDILKYKIVDVDTNSYPKIINSVPCMLIENKVLPGVELFKFLEYIVEEYNKESEPESDNSANNPNMFDTQNTNNPVMFNTPHNMRNLNKPPEDNNRLHKNPDKPTNDNDGDLPGFCINGKCDLGFSSIDDSNLQEGKYEYLDSEESTKSCSIDNVTNKGEKAKQMDDDYSRMMSERSNDIMPNS